MTWSHNIEMFWFLFTIFFLWASVLFALDAPGDVQLLRDSVIYSNATMTSSLLTELPSGTVVKVLCQTLDTNSKPNNDSTPVGRSVWSKVNYLNYTGFIPYAHMEQTESWLPGAPRCNCNRPGVLYVDNVKMTHDKAVKTLLAHNISLGCSNEAGRVCPSLEGIRVETIEGLANFVETSKCKEIQ
ncbi:hypothetical protein K7432_018615, partial [Basidiobolus ranarum]